jgi:hypothetical protein
MIWWEDWIEQAEWLARRESGKPKEASLRRAVSTAYYAMFHELNRTVADALLASSTPWPVYALAYRAIDHQGAKRLFERARLRGSQEFTTLGARVENIGAAFIRLQAERHRADYDPEPYPHGRYAVSEMVAQAKDACQELGNLPVDVKRALAVFLIASKRK